MVTVTIKKIIIGTFVKKTEVLSFLERLRNEFKIKISRIYVNEVEDNSVEYLVTFQAEDRRKYLEKLPTSKVFHSKCGCIFSINALNMLTEREKPTEDSPNEACVIDWCKYHNHLATVVGNELSMKPYKRVDKATLLF